MNLPLEEIAVDPFATDIFAAHPKQIASDDPKKISELANLWSKNLTKVSRSAAVRDDLQRGLPAFFSAGLPSFLAESLAFFFNPGNESAIEILFAGERELNRAEDFVFENGWRLTVRVEQSSAEICLEIDDAFAVRLIDSMLGETNFGDGQIRNLTLSEQAILEFLSVNLTGAANRKLNAPLFRFKSLSREIPAFLKLDPDSETPAIIVANWQIVHESLSGTVKIYFAPEALRALQKSENRLLDVKRNSRADWKNLQIPIKNARMRLTLGTVELSVGEIAAIEKDDVILLENHDLIISGEELSGRAALFLGDGKNVKIFGKIAAADPVSGAAIEETAESGDNKISIRRLSSKSSWQIKIESFEELKIPMIREKFMTETGDDNANELTEETSGQTGLAVENLAVALRVELEARRLSLAEVGNLRENQILELGIRPTDAVNLLIDDKIVGRGELVAVEDRLGVRITKLLR